MLWTIFAMHIWLIASPQYQLYVGATGTQKLLETLYVWVAMKRIKQNEKDDDSKGLEDVPTEWTT
jgi:hypothetical protein